LKLKHLYEERITAWNAVSIEEAIELAERETDEYARGDKEPTGPLQGHWLLDDWMLPMQGAEVFSLLRESDLEPEEYVKTFFETGHERLGQYGAEGGASPERP
jgi:hypothetical protein